MSSRARARLFNTVHQSGGGGSASSDWTARSTAGGVVQAIRFPSATNVTAYKHGDGQAANVVFDGADGVIGDGCLRINVPSTADANAGSWRAPLNSSWVSDGQGFGSTAFYIQYRIKLGPSRLTESNGGGGFKVSNVSEYIVSDPNSSRSHPDNEIVVNNQNWRGSIFVYRECDTGTTGLDVTDGNGIHLQPAVDYGAGVTPNGSRYCLYPGTAGCFAWVEGVWITIYMRIKIVNYGGSTGNEFDLYAALAGDTSYTQLFNNRNFNIGADAGLPNGVNGIFLLPYDTNRTNASYTTNHKYDQLICSTSPIACPQV